MVTTSPKASENFARTDTWAEEVARYTQGKNYGENSNDNNNNNNNDDNNNNNNNKWQESWPGWAPRDVTVNFQVMPCQ